MRTDDGGRRRERVEITLPDGPFDRLLLGLGAAALVAVVPVLWIWLLYGSALSGPRIYAAAVGLCALTAAIGGAMIRILEGGR